MFSWPQRQFEVSGQLHAHATLPPRKDDRMGPRDGLVDMEKGVRYLSTEHYTRAHSFVFEKILQNMFRPNWPSSSG
jgi:hypothetical protein